jgi:hypothetical protein
MRHRKLLFGWLTKVAICIFHWREKIRKFQPAHIVLNGNFERQTLSRVNTSAILLRCSTAAPPVAVAGLSQRVIGNSEAE